MEGLISDAHAKCYFAFEDVLNALQHPVRNFDEQISQKKVGEEFEKYKIWAGNVGAAHSGKRYEISLDYRLREASFFKRQVLSLLGTLNDKTTTVSSLLRGERTPFEERDNALGEDLSGSSSSENNDDDDVPGKEIEEESDESPWEISSNSSGESVASRKSTLPAHNSMQTTRTVKPLAPTNPILTLGRTPQAEMPRLLDSITFTIACLYRIPIRKPAPLDRLKHQTSIDSALYQHFDVMYIKDKFPLLDEALATRLGKMNTRRRQLLYYREAHKQSLDTARVQPKVVPGERQFVLIADLDVDPNTAGRQTTPSQQTVSQAATSHFTLRSKATTIKLGDGSLPLKEEDVDIMALYAPSIAASKSSMASSFTGNDLRIEVPHRPQNEDGEELEWFECPYCLITKNITTAHKWKKHVLEDLQPYICTYGDCNLYNHFFESRDAWFKHEAQHHRIKWFCNTDNHPEYEREEDFRIHMAKDHDTFMDETQFKLLSDVFRHPTRGIEGTCNLCMRSSKKLRSHVSRHLQQISLFALPRINDSAGSGEAERDHDSLLDENKRLARSHTTNSSVDSESPARGYGKNLPDVTDAENIQEPPDIIDDFEVEDIPEVANVSWDDVTDKFSNARRHEYRPLKVLVYGKSAPSPNMVAQCIERLKCEPTRQETRSKALQRLSANGYDIVFIDVKSGDEGVALARAIRNSSGDDFNPHIPMVALLNTKGPVPGLGYYDTTLEFSFGMRKEIERKLVDVFGLLCAWQPSSLEDRESRPTAESGTASDRPEEIEGGMHSEERHSHLNPHGTLSRHGSIDAQAYDDRRSNTS
ncbi:hypothetical protein P154DRAFT_254087 [Amniculicola lignicola CBS 123094]|uniref:Oxidoreductase acuF-like C2H2 type zinc-finger domain-containing protein n=1 Tax=Amniculicola lignicola CBS 123094 TaxID=1392246 RepID=A0A6A5X0M6_9PLEO|nr:hypothetical protein P154DRAFT_254087 [Amniculicola lignicola CBS 123094]